ncbi:MAG: class II glutamine amidotransferase [Archangiaceae bacterium]|nr:class II glutamine amidotransferase [Archangiaceae bacterium]
MCRIFAVRSRDPWAVAPAFESLKRLSVQHKDGWGVVQFDDDSAAHHRDVCAAHLSEHFSNLTRSLKSRNLLAHIREASVGGAHPANTHPFQNGRWVFCHNGTVRGFDQHPQPLDALLDPKWKPHIKGQTDSERCFYLFLTYLEDATDLESVCAALGKTVRTVAGLYPGTDEKPTTLNLLVTDGCLTAITRHKKGLFHVERDGLKMIASEPMVDGEQWREVPEEHLLTIDAQLVAKLRPIP